MIFTVIHEDSPHFTAEASEIIGVAKNYIGGYKYSAIILLKNGGQYEFQFPMEDCQIDKIRQNWLLTRTKINFPSPDVVITV